MKRLTTILLASLLMLLNGSCVGCSSSANPIEPDKPGIPGGGGGEEPDEPDEPAVTTKNNSFNMVGVDHLGRSFTTVSAFKKDKQVGIFYWPWIGQPYASGIYDATKIMQRPNGLKILTDFKYHDRSISPDGQAHYWGEPLWGYYNSEDEWVIRKQMQMLTTAGVDFVFFDTTNAIIYANVLLKVCAVIDEMLKNGWNAPKVVFYTHSHSFQTVRDLYREIYQPNKFPNTWYMKDGKPMIIGYTDPADDLREAASRNDHSYQPGVMSDEIRNFFHFMKPQWPFDPIYPDGFPWIEWTFPQPLHTESQVMNVTVASHPKCPMSFSLTRENWINWGRGWDPIMKQNVSSDVDKGTFFQKQWDHAITVDPPMISVGGWNEWIAYKQAYDGEYMLCDAADREYSRDIEPMAGGGYQDAYYIQLIKNIRRYKGIEANIVQSKGKTIDLKGAVSQWNDVEYAIRNMDEKFMARDAFGGAKTVRYTQAAPANKPLEVRIVNDAQNIYIYLKGQSAWAGNMSDANWLNILIGTGEPELKEWESYEYIVGRTISDTEISVEKLRGGFNGSVVGKGKFVKSDDVIQISIPRSALGLSDGSKFYFKVAMDVQKPAEIMNYYQSGSVMPMGRLSYMYNMCN